MADVTRSWPSVAVIAAGLLLALAPVAHGAFPGRNGFIAYVHSASRSQAEEGEGPATSTNALMVGRLFGQERFTLRTCTRVDDVPQEPACDTSYDSRAYSPIGDTLLVDAGDRLAILASDGSDFRLLPQQTANDGAPAWAPDGERFVFTGVAEGASEPDLYVYGSGRRLLTRKNGLAPNWSPHGTKIAFVRKGNLYVIGANGKGLRRVGGRRFSVEAEDVTLVAGRTFPRLPRFRGRHHGRRRHGTP